MTLEPGPSQPAGQGPLFERRTWRIELQRLLGLLVEASRGVLLCRRKGQQLMIEGNLESRALVALQKNQPSDELMRRAGALLASRNFWMTRGKEGIAIDWLFSPKEDHFGELLTYAAGAKGPSESSSDETIGDME